MDKPRVLIAVPYHPSKPYAWPLFMRSLHAILAATKTAELEICVRFDPNLEYGKKDNVKSQREWFRRRAQEGGFDYLFFHGHDTIPPADVIDRLLAHKRDVVSGVYWRRQKDGGDHAIAWWKGVPSEEKDAALKCAEGSQEIDGFGLDCCLISKDALEAVSWLDWDVNDDDWPFCEAAKKAGFQLYVDASIQCRHYEDATNYSFRGVQSSEKDPVIFAAELRGARMVVNRLQEALAKKP